MASRAESPDITMTTVTSPAGRTHIVEMHAAVYRGVRTQTVTWCGIRPTRDWVASGSDEADCGVCRRLYDQAHPPPDEPSDAPHHDPPGDRPAMAAGGADPEDDAVPVMAGGNGASAVTGTSGADGGHALTVSDGAAAASDGAGPQVADDEADEPPQREDAGIWSRPGPSDEATREVWWRPERPAEVTGNTLLADDEPRPPDRAHRP